jgi:CelD/BcsL family acetyltransferase involved in cellulose biosynthesis
MAQSAALGRLVLLEEAVQTTGAMTAADGFTVTVTHRLADIEPVWRALTATSIESPGQSFDFVRLWVKALGVPEENQFYVVAEEHGVPVALMALQRRWDKGARVLSWFPGPHVGCDAPIVDTARVAAMTPQKRRRLWIRMLRGVSGADVVYLKAVPQILVGETDLFAELGQWIEAETLYRAAFQSFEEADKTQRNKSRRKHDRQQGDKLEAMGTVTFEEIENGPDALKVLDTMFAQRAARFREMRVFNPFSVPAIRAFYDSTAALSSGVSLKLHVMRLNGEIVAMRYNVVHNERLFCLISSMSEDPALRPGSPGKQCLLRVMQTVFGQGFRVFDMGEGLTDEKRHWCNQQITVRHHYIPITRRGAIVGSLHRRWQVTRTQIKSDPRMLALAKDVRAWMLKLSGKSAGSEKPAQED